ncbi:MAG: hypothetical protein OEL89_04565, partial [Candidatus Peregrinibacteria bacterium]|nr:hypothetical protein [Candidatus Peregrinibacteria bacterium]
IDVFIITKAGEIWTVRFFVFVVLKLFKKIAKPHDHAGKICPNHFITEKKLEIIEKDPYSANLFANVRFLAGDREVYEKFMSVNNWWITTKNYEKKDEKFQLEQKNSKFEDFLKRIQIKKIKSNPEYKTPRAKIVLEDYELRFHPEPKNRGCVGS